MGERNHASHLADKLATLASTPFFPDLFIGVGFPQLATPIAEIHETYFGVNHNCSTHRCRIRIYSPYVGFSMRSTCKYYSIAQYYNMGGEFTSAEASRLAGFKKPYMLNHLEREGIFLRESFKDRRHGRARKYSFGDVLVLRSINRMLELGARPARIKSVINELTKLKGFTDTREAAEFASRSLGTSLFISSTDALLIDSDERVLELLQSGQMAFGFFLKVNDISKEVIDIVEAYEKKKRNNLKVDMPILEALCADKGL